ncbi:Ribonuclease III [Gloeothece citriformis PCC 7424]|uniref:Ribonuclease 3 n=1 Tax=Gloeothece citriformis (strain PCC 7424) TaxID=65393 RepID=B7KKK0_GLOC7|nr:ribonuclease III [Gloeothece citriformis]ACK72333.1 Ribonuclease III [Gloeothece citriformis PCC 7424]
MLNLPQLKNQQLWLCALTHRSYVNEHLEIKEHNERLEFLGDAVLAFVAGEFLYQRYPHLSEAQLSRLRARLVDETQLAKFAVQLGIGQLMRLGKGAIKDGGRENPALLSDTFEAIIGAYFLDAGIDAVREFVRPLFQSVADILMVAQSEILTSEKLLDPKNRFQQWTLANFTQNPEYVIIEESGPDHAKEFTAQVKVQGIVYGIGRGRRKQEATKTAAEAALKKIGLF